MKLDDIRRNCLRHIQQLQGKFGYHANSSQLTPKDRRIIGTYWEIMFCQLAYDFGRAFTPVQITTTKSQMDKSAQWYLGSNGKSIYLLPDIVIWTFPGEHHEIKHKDPFSMNQHGDMFGLEQYRLEALLQFCHTTGQDVLYTIHNHALIHGNLRTRNRMSDWLTISVSELDGRHVYRQKNGKTLYDGKYKEKPILYWPSEIWTPLETRWANQDQDSSIFKFAKDKKAFVRYLDGGRE